MSKSYLGQMGLPRGIRNNNPGNLIKTNIGWQGKVPNGDNTDGKFEQFINVKYGIRAMLRDILNDISKGKNTVQKLIWEYAPPSENNTQNYISQVAKALGISSDSIIKTVNADFLLNIAKIIIRVENGAVAMQYITDEDIKEAIEIIGDTSGYGIQIEKKKSLFGNVTKVVLLMGFSLFCLFF